MGTSSSPAEVARKFAVLGAELSNTRPALSVAGLHGKGIFLAALRAKGVSGSTRVSRGVKARFDVKPREVVIRYTGSAHLLNDPTKAHRVQPRARGKKRAIVIPGVGPRANANHPGTRGLRFFDIAKREGYRQLPKVYAKAGLELPLRRAFR